MGDRNLDLARAYLAAGFSLVPVRLDGSKRPVCAWKEYESRPPTDQELREWFDRPRPYGIALLGGAVSGNAEYIDFDHRAEEVFPAWRDLVEAERPGLVNRLALTRTPRPGWRISYRVADCNVPGNQKLAQEQAGWKNNGKPDLQALVETRGEGGYALAPGCPAACHKTGRLYVYAGGPPLTSISTVSKEERDTLIRCARAFDSTPLEASASSGKPNPEGGERVGDHYERAGPDWAEIIGPAGWECVRTDGETRYWRRPGKDGRGWSATTGKCRGPAGEDLFRVFSSNAHPFEDGRAYGKFRAYWWRWRSWTRGSVHSLPTRARPA